MELSEHQLAAAARAATAEDLLQLARSEGLSLTADRAEALFVRLHAPTGELSDQELDAVSGGGCYHGVAYGEGFVYGDNISVGSPERERLYNSKGLGVGDVVRYANPLMAVHGSGHCQNNQFVITGIDREGSPDAVQGFVCKIACRTCQERGIVAYLGQLDLL